MVSNALAGLLVLRLPFLGWVVFLFLVLLYLFPCRVLSFSIPLLCFVSQGMVALFFVSLSFHRLLSLFLIVASIVFTPPPPPCPFWYLLLIFVCLKGLCRVFQLTIPHCTHLFCSTLDIYSPFVFIA